MLFLNNECTPRITYIRVIKLVGSVPMPVFDWIKNNSYLLSFCLVVVLAMIVVDSGHAPKGEDVKCGLAVEDSATSEDAWGDLFPRITTLTYIRSDAASGKLIFREEPVSDIAPAYTFEWVALVLGDIPELKPAATLFLKEKNIGTLMHVYEEAFRLADSEIEKIENSDDAVRESQEKLKKALLKSQN